MSAPRVIGLDLSLTGSGVATDSIGTFTIRPGDLRGLPRLAYIRGHIEGLLSTTPADLAVLEGPAYSRAGGAGHHEAAGLWWMVAGDLTAAGIGVLIASPSTLKKYATGRGNATKADMRMALFQRTELDLRDDNQVDAWWLHAIGLEYLGHPAIPLPAAQVAASCKLTRIGGSE